MDEQLQRNRRAARRRDSDTRKRPRGVRRGREAARALHQLVQGSSERSSARSPSQKAHHADAVGADFMVRMNSNPVILLTKSMCSDFRSVLIPVAASVSEWTVGWWLRVPASG